MEPCSSDCIMREKKNERKIVGEREKVKEYQRDETISSGSILDQFFLLFLFSSPRGWHNKTGACAFEVNLRDVRFSIGVFMPENIQYVLQGESLSCCLIE